ncbi:lipid II:glycine glycyltransferase FemX [Calditrichota bacterium]
MKIITFSLYNNEQMKAWDKFIESHPNSTGFHCSAWLRCVQLTYKYNCSPSVFMDDNNKIKGIFPFFEVNNIFRGKSIVSLPFSDYGGPLTTDPQVEIELLKNILSICKNQNKNLEIRGPIESHKELFVSYGYFKRHTIHLSSNPDEVKKNIDKRTIQYCIRKALKYGVEIKEDNTLNGINKFYELNLLTRKKHGVPTQTLSLFNNIYNEMIFKNLAFILLANIEKQTIAAGIFFKFKDTIYYKYNASNPKYMSKISPNHLLTWYAIKQACLGGFNFFDFGRTASDNQGLMRYKEMWGSDSNTQTYFSYPDIKGLCSLKENTGIYKILTSFWRTLPISISEKIGPFFQRLTG